MRREDLYDGITGIREDLIEKAAPDAVSKKKKHTRRIRPWMAAAAAVLAVVLIFNVALGGGLRGYALAEVQYPKRTQDNILSHDQHWDERIARLDLADETEKISSQYLAAVLPELLTGEGENRICSPLNLYFGLAMLAELTAGETRAQILKLLDCGEMDALRTQVDNLWNITYQDDGTVTTKLANSIWLAEDLPYLQEVMDTLAEVYHVSSYQGKMGSAGYNRALQTWLNQNTNGMVKKAAGDVAMDPEDVFALASTLYYKAMWSHKFDKGATESETFHAPAGDETVKMMHSYTAGTYFWGEHFGATWRGLRNSGEMILILPDEGYTPEDILATGEVADFLSVLRNDSANWENSGTYFINLALPAFDVSSNLDLMDALQDLGLEDVLVPGVADFSPMMPEGALEVLNPFLSAATQATRVVTDEEGVEGASYVVIHGAGGAAQPDDEVDFILDRPFLFAITGDTGELLFVGVVNHP